MLHSESTLRSAAPLVPDDEIARVSEQALVLAGGTLVELHPPRVFQADIVLRGAVIEQVGGAYPDGLPRIDIGGCIVTPAFTNAHTHSYMTLAAGMPAPAREPRSYTERLREIWWKVDKALDDELVTTSALVAAAAAARAGVTCLVDLHSSPRAIEGSLDRVAAAFDEVGVRGILAYETTDREGRARRDAALKENRRFLQKVTRSDAQHRALVGAHALMSLNDDTLEALRDLADVHDVGLHLQVAEDGTDAADAERTRKTSVLQRLTLLEAMRPGSILAQCSELPPELLPRIADAGAFTRDFAALEHAKRPADVRRQRPARRARHRRRAERSPRRSECLRPAARRSAQRARARGGRAARRRADIVGAFVCRSRRAALHSWCPCGLRRPRLHAAHADDAIEPHRARFSTLERGPTSGTRSRVVASLVRDHALVTIDEAGLVQRARLASARLWERMASWRMEQLAGTKYQIVRRLGEGGMGVVYQVVKPPNIQGVLKLMSADLTQHEELRVRFFDEVRILAQLDHPNIVKVFDYDALTDGTPYYVMELLQGRSVREALDSVGRMQPRVAYEITRQLLEALQAAHTNAIPVIHRDIKPDNIYLHQPKHGEPLVKLIDFGVSSLGDRKHDDTFVGTWSYAAPEQIRGERPTPQTDLYSVALVLYEMLAGRGAFDHHPDWKLLSIAQLEEIPAPVSHFAPWVPPSNRRVARAGAVEGSAAASA